MKEQDQNHGIDGKKLLKMNIKKDEKVSIKCCRKYICEKCYEKKYKEMDKMKLEELLENKDLEWYIRYKLGQRDFNDKINTEHMRICFDAISKEEVENNNNIIKLFEKFYGDKKVVLETSKGTVNVEFINKKMESIFIDLSGCVTVEIIKYILEDIAKKYSIINYEMKNGHNYYEKIKRIYLLVDYEKKEEIKKKGGYWDVE